MIFRRKKASVVLTAHIEGALQPIHRGDWFDRAIEAELLSVGCRVDGGGTLLNEDRTIASCDLEIVAPAKYLSVIRDLSDLLERAGAPVGSELRLPDGSIVPLGTWLSVDVGVGEEYGVRDGRPDRDVPGNERVDRLVSDLGQALGDRGEVRSWSVYDLGAYLHVFAPDEARLFDGLRECIASGVLPKNARVTRSRQ